MKIAVIGSGLAGLSSAYSLSKKGHDVTVFEKYSYPGGLCHTWKIDRYYFDFGPHFFHTSNPEIQKLVRDLLRGGIYRKIFYSKTLVDGKYHDFPVSAANIFKFPLRKQIKILAELLTVYWNRLTKKSLNSLT